ncbi:hypothetical protein [Pseudomonas mediterranea]|uniref:hypothetical protein n=1 Tax=Pseudomonas mediterranea TaxID=183795 RepID=UPI0006D8A8B5|nr:hypothetical protein [Pseudomonas mediterranea]
MKHEGWAAPLAMVFFLITGLQIGAQIGSTKTQELNATTIKGMQTQLQEKDDIIADKDSRLRSMQDLQLKSQDFAGGAVTQAAKAAGEAARAAAEAATAASKSAESAKEAAAKP